MHKIYFKPYRNFREPLYKLHFKPYINWHYFVQ